MAGAIGSAVVGEAVSKMLSSLLSGDGAADCSWEIKLERLEMAVLKLETVVSVSEDWQIAHPPLLHWKAKLELVAEQGRHHILRAREGDRIATTQQQQLRRRREGTRISSSFPRRVARAARRFVPFIHGDDDEVSEGMVRRFERLAHGADSFLHLVERAGSRRCPKVIFVLPASVTSAGKVVELSMRMGGGTAVILLQPWWLVVEGDERKTNACLWISYEHDTAWEKNMKLMAAFHLPSSSSSSSDNSIIRIAMDLVELLPSQQFTATRAAMKELVAEMGFHGRTSPAPSTLYTSFLRAIQSSHRYGFEPAAAKRGGTSPEQVLLIMAHCYVVPPPHGWSTEPPVELVWHSSPHYLPKKLSEQHEPMMKLAGVTTDGTSRQWWCPRTSTRLSMEPTTSPAKGILRWYSESQASSSAEVTGTADCNTSELSVGD